MDYKIFLPPRALAHVVRGFWTLEGSASLADPMPYRLFADACPNLTFSYGNPFKQLENASILKPFPTSLLHGQTSKYQDMTVAGQFGIVGAYMYPSSLRLLFGLSAEEITNQWVDAKALLGTEGKELEEKMVNCPTNEQRIGLITDYFLKKINKATFSTERMHFCVNRILETRGAIKMSDITDQVNLSKRQLERNFFTSSGLSPKLFSRITRFRHVIRLSNFENVSSLSSLAYEAGYSDQSHFIREFKEFSGYTPKSYFKTLSSLPIRL